MAEKTIVITGGARGLGRLMCEEAARRGARVIVAVRDRDRAAEAMAELARLAVGPAPELLVVDLSSSASIEAAAGEARRRFARVDALVNNAGIVNYEGILNDEGIELSIATNYLGALRFTESLLPSMGRGSRIVNLSSSAATRGSLDVDRPRVGKGVWKGYRNYASSKLAVLVWSLDLARRLAPSGIAVNALHPGVVNTGITRFPGPLGALVELILLVRWQGPELGVRTAVDLALSEEYEGVTGAFFWRDRRRRLALRHDGEAAASRLRARTEALLDRLP
ncbi:MAG TPA: SDR family NAD(P)-dependent oxidoreductase [Rectinemataceae bacterium]|nr:SDR family NAD(P)-dependent oxidoreductase [Rectinemataceae bacterium]